MQEKTNNNSKIQKDIQIADAAYKPFPSFKEWQTLNLDLVRWNRYSDLINQRKNVSSETLRRAREIVKRVAAIETGAIEELYQVDRGFTFTVATEAATWQAAVQAKGTIATVLIEAQLRAYDFVLDFATKNAPLAEAWIRQLHTEICRGQQNYIVHTEVGAQNQILPLGEYKKHPNHVKTPEGLIHSYAPVDMTSSEMGRFYKELHSQEFTAAHPILQAAYSHYCLVAIHPFADGNGRVARALSSVFTYRAQSAPLLILAEHRKEYFTALSQADQGNYQAFLDFILERTLDALQLVEESLRAAKAPPMEESLENLRKLYVTSGGFTHAEVDRAADILRGLILQEFNRVGTEHSIPNQFQMGISSNFNRDPSLNQYYRAPLSGVPSQSIISFNAFEPAQAQVRRTFFLSVPIDCGVHDDIILQNVETAEAFGARVIELVPQPTPSTKMRVKMWVESIVGESALELKKLAEKNLKDRGYLK